MLRIRRKDDPTEKYLEGTLFDDERVCIDFNKQIVMIWNGAYWKETPFSDYKTISYWTE